MSGARQIALGGVFAALGVVLLLLGGIVPIAVYLCPMLASFLLLLLQDRLSLRLRIGWYLAVALLGLLLCTEKECAAVFAALGYYPLLRPRLSRLPRLPRVICKLLLFNLAISALYALLLFVFRLPSVTEEARELTLALGIVFAVLGNLAFLFYDILLGRIGKLLRKR